MHRNSYWQLRKNGGAKNMLYEMDICLEDIAYVVLLI
jgi:hypothetical protein